MGSREEIVAAAAKVMREQGYAHATTKAIARAAGYSEALLYKHFKDKTEIFTSVLTERLPALGTTLDELMKAAADAPLAANLARLARITLSFYLESFPIAVSLFSSRELLATHRERVMSRDRGPDVPLVRVAEYLREEVRLGRIREDADLDASASLLLGACFQYAFLASFEDREPSPEELDAWAERLAGTLVVAVTS
ncbi:TetR/AcrR family transcriptional regulator [Amycolatopsis keratiniphila]|uniref:TetR family transcriptional regulator n=1 Tax=Amycolatopsis keratiniphila subsp. keratiniphila TaxID=227715 RepID=A0A1W2LRH4_9PSEU|nr:TetR/AcrR family transcriptional regulator [Amycolatopsis keratiniphila]OLZ59601.1 TetR family transcriptional regulator [Amycolatopsis keratiniphila subsp. nogabecina]ONF66931.1 TetR family transcriptional regulator [Amycolatopsis keratiniphila subsp. keratiniphila]SDU54171.1 DNA-binding transcriptional regulator, AcrR family [Amycolatopsis keratiniphila]